MERTRSWLNDVDWLTVSVWFALVTIGCFSIYSATYSERIGESFFSLDNSFGKQLMWVGISVLLAGTALLLDSKFFAAFTWIFYATGLLLLILVIVAGREVHGQKNWLGVGGFGIQPTEIAKYTTCLALAKFLARNAADITFRRDKIYAAIIICLPPALVLLQGDFGSALVYLAFLFPLYREGLEPVYPLAVIYGVAVSLLVFLLANTTLPIKEYEKLSSKELLHFTLLGVTDLKLHGLHGWEKLKYLFSANLRPLVVLTFVFAGAIWYIKKNSRLSILPALAIYIASVLFIFVVSFGFYKLPERHQHRINVMFGKEIDYNVKQSKIAIGSGGFAGKGFLQGTQTKGKFVPEQSTDFIFCTIGEEGGFIGSITLLGLFTLLIFRLLKMAARQRSDFSRIYAYSVAGVFILHVIVNIGMTIGLTPVIGIPLPFISYGGSSLIAFTLLLFTMVKLDSQRQQVFR